MRIRFSYYAERDPAPPEKSRFVTDRIERNRANGQASERASERRMNNTDNGDRRRCRARLKPAAPQQRLETIGGLAHGIRRWRWRR